MLFKKVCLPALTILLTVFISGCSGAQIPATPSPLQPANPAKTIPPQANPTIPTAQDQLTPASFLKNYAFPGSFDPAKKYLIYLHGKIIEDQGIPAISPDYGEYEYAAILDSFAKNDFVVISEQRPENTNGDDYAGKVAGQVRILLDAGIPAKNISVVGASKGAGIAISISHLLQNKDLNFVLIAICSPDQVENYTQNNVTLYGNVLSIYDSIDQMAGSCKKLFTFSEGKGISRHDEVILKIGLGHGLVFKPLDAWMIPAMQWAGKP